MFCDSYILTLNELELSLEIDDIPLETELDSLDEDSADDDELSCSVSTADKSDDELDELDELSLETEFSELASLDEPASPAGRLLELADSELEEDEAVSELDEDDSLEKLELACPAVVSDEGWDDDSDDTEYSKLDELASKLWLDELSA